MVLCDINGTITIKERHLLRANMEIRGVLRVVLGPSRQ